MATNKHEPNQAELDQLDVDIRRTRKEVEETETLFPAAHEADERRAHNQDLMPRTDDGNPM